MRKFFSNRIFISVVVFILIIPLIFSIYRKQKTARIINETINSQRYKERVELFKNNPPPAGSIIFLGDSHTEGFNLEPLGIPNAVNRGISGDFSEGLLKRLDEITAAKPDKIFIEIGTNDIVEKVPPQKIKENYEKIIQQIQEQSPQTKIFIQSIFPCNVKGSWLTSNEDLNKRINETNLLLKEMANKKQLPFIDMHSKLAVNNSLPQSLTSDGIHLNYQGNAIWVETLKPFLK
jgi:lysophospholipase L1-like esterase